MFFSPFFVDSSPIGVYVNPAAQLAPFSPFASLAAFSPTAALSAVSPTLQIFNPAVNPRAALLQFNPGAAPTLALLGGGIPPGKFYPPTAFGKYGKAPFGKVPFGKFPFGKEPYGKGYGPVGKTVFGRPIS